MCKKKKEQQHEDFCDEIQGFQKQTRQKFLIIKLIRKNQCLAEKVKPTNYHYTSE